jgi:hypothetical protein
MTKQNKILSGIIAVTLAIAGGVAVLNSDGHKTYRDDIFTCGTKAAPKNYYQFASEDFNTKYGLRAGDTVAIKVGPNGENFIDNIDLGLGSSSGITLVPDTGNKKEIEIGWIGLGGDAINWTINGKTKYLKRGFLLTDKNHFGFSLGCVGNIEIANCHVNGASMGIQLLTMPGHTYTLNYQRLYSHGNLIENTLNEGEYLGYVHDSPIAMDIHVDGDTLLNLGRDAIQTRNTDTVLIENVYADRIGMNNEETQNHGILFGSNSNGGTVRNSKVLNVTGIAIWNGGWGDFTYECNELQAQTMGIMSRSNYPEGDVQNTGRQSQVIKNNKITSVKSIECYYESNGKKISVDAENNMVTGTVNISDSITKTVTNNGANVVPNCGTVKPTPSKEVFWRGYKDGLLPDRKRFFFIIYKEQTGFTIVQTNGKYEPL